MALKRPVFNKFLALLTLSGVLLLFLFYAPLAGELKRWSSECRKVEAETLQARSQVSGFQSQEIRNRFISEAEVSVALDELARRGKLYRVKFLSLTPGRPEKMEGAGYRVLPVELVTESGHEGLGRFLGALDEIQKGIVTVGEFTVKSLQADPSRLEARLTLRFHLAENEGLVGELHGLTPLVRPARKDEFSSWGKNPFMPHGLTGGPPSAVSLNGIAWDEKNPKAVINDRIVGVGDEIAGYRVTEIKHASVVLTSEEGERELRV